MGQYLIGDVCRVLNLKPHVIRYWEKEISFISPVKDQGGRRIYSHSDINILFRIKYLLYEKKYTIEGAKQKLFEELSSGRPNTAASIRSLRSDLLALYHKVKKED